MEGPEVVSVETAENMLGIGVGIGLVIGIACCVGVELVSTIIGAWLG